jgi:hypothetical protein
MKWLKRESENQYLCNTFQLYWRNVSINRRGGNVAAAKMSAIG